MSESNGIQVIKMYLSVINYPYTLLQSFIPIGSPFSVLHAVKYDVATNVNFDVAGLLL